MILKLSSISRFVLIMLMLFVSATCMANTVFHISPFGNDADPGTLQKPFKTIEKARNTIRKLNKQMKEDIIVYLHGSVYKIDKTLIFENQDGGNNNYSVIYKSFAEERPVVSGGVSITGWKEVGKGIWKANAKGFNFRQLYINDQRAIRARQPNRNENYFLKSWDVAGHRIVVNASQVLKWKNFEEVEMVLHQEWAESYLRLKSFSTYGTVSNMDSYISIQDEESKILFPRPYPPKINGQAFHFENALEFLDEAGEWWLDIHANEIYYKTEPNENMTALEVIAPSVETIIKIEGTLDKPVKI